MFDQPEGRTAGPALKTRLQAPDLPHVRYEAALDRKLFGLGVDRFIDRQIQCGNAMLVFRQARGPFDQHVVPQQSGKQEPGGDRLAGAHPFVGAR